jgi:hypothetical protein
MNVTRIIQEFFVYSKKQNGSRQVIADCQIKIWYSRKGFVTASWEVFLGQTTSSALAGGAREGVTTFLLVLD